MRCFSLCRDGFHLSETYGRFTAAAVWYKTFTGEKVRLENPIKENEDFDAGIIDIIKNFYCQFLLDLCITSKRCLDFTKYYLNIVYKLYLNKFTIEFVVCITDIFLVSDLYVF